MRPDVDIFQMNEVSHVALLVQAHEHGADPRRDSWIPQHSPKAIRFHQVVVHNSGRNRRIFSDSSGSVFYSLPHRHWSESSISKHCAGLPKGPTIIEMEQLVRLACLGREALMKELCLPVNGARADSFRWYLDYFLDKTNVLLDGLKKVQGYSVIVAVNLPSLLAALLIKQIHGVPVVYEALEYWPEIDPEAGSPEINFWKGIEARLVQHVDYASTVSPGLANLMTRVYGREFGVVPNCCPRSEGVGSLISPENSEPIRFLFQGGFAPHRGLEQIIRAFASTGVSAHLFLRGKKNEYQQQLVRLASEKGVLNKKVFFLDAVSSTELVRAAHDSADVGIIPYFPAGNNYKYCSPNKLGEFLAANMPILANRTEFVASIIERSKAGVVVDFSDESKLVEAIIRLSNDRESLIAMSKNSREFFLNYYNWESRSKAFYARLLALVRGSDVRSFYIDDAKAIRVRDNEASLPSTRSLISKARVGYLLKPIWFRLPARTRQYVVASVSRAWRRLRNL